MATRLRWAAKAYKSGPATKNVVLTLVERGGSARIYRSAGRPAPRLWSRTKPCFHIDSTSIADIIPIVLTNVHRESIMMTDEALHYRSLGKEYLSHDAVNHSAKEYVRYSGIDVITTNTVEGFYSIFKRGMKGVYQHCREKHLHRYLAEFDFRYNNRIAVGINDTVRAENALKGIVGKRLTYRRPDKAHVH